MIRIEITGDQPAAIGHQLTALAALFGVQTSNAPALVESFVTGDTETTTAVDDEPAPRLRGKAGEGRARRTKEEMAEDEALEKLAASAGIAIEDVDAKLAEGNSRADVIASLERAIRENTDTAEEPKEPEAETKADTPPAGDVSREDVRKAIVEAAAKVDQPKRGDFVQSLLNPFGVKKLGDLPDEKLGALMAAVTESQGVDSALD
ncbi:hypothetical protein VQ042_11680 [Aurantimonas sp. A2-1-M11]|uniref:hypothetical protein n=1 Tax=Aurantimonas sp. A2-1-M11 TaxID=3113712 RepID=UPI002F952B61